MKNTIAEKKLVFKFNDNPQNYLWNASHLDEEEIVLIEQIFRYNLLGSPNFDNYEKIEIEVDKFNDDEDNDEFEIIGTTIGKILSIDGCTVDYGDGDSEISSEIDTLNIEQLQKVLEVCKLNYMQKIFLRDEELNRIQHEKNVAFKVELKELTKKCVNKKLVTLLNKIYKRCLAENIPIYISDLTKYKFDVEIEEDFGDNTMTFLEDGIVDEELGIDGWVDSPLDTDYAKFLRGWKWDNVLLTDGNHLLISREDEDDTEEAYFLAIVNSDNLCDGEIEWREYR